MNDLQVLVVFGTFFAGGIVLAFLIFLLDHQDRRAMEAAAELDRRPHPAE